MRPTATHRLSAAMLRIEPPDAAWKQLRAQHPAVEDAASEVQLVEVEDEYRHLMEGQVAQESVCTTAVSMVTRRPLASTRTRTHALKAKESARPRLRMVGEPVSKMNPRVCPSTAAETKSLFMRTSRGTVVRGVARSKTGGRAGTDSRMGCLAQAPINRPHIKRVELTVLGAQFCDVLRLLHTELFRLRGASHGRGRVYSVNQLLIR